jgi:hypothetical protein
LGPIPNPQSPIPNPQSPIPNISNIIIIYLNNLLIKLKYIIYINLILLNYNNLHKKNKSKTSPYTIYDILISK